MRFSHWNIINFEAPDELPDQNQDIYFSIAEGEGRPFPPAARTAADLNSFRDLLTINPDWLIIWQPVPPPPNPPNTYQIKSKIICRASAFQQIRCEYFESGICLMYEHEGSCPHRTPIRKILLAENSRIGERGGSSE